jgi:hypothetical protein
VSGDNGTTWKVTVLQAYNTWIIDGTLSQDFAWVRVTSIDGSQVVVKKVTLASGEVTLATKNY